MDAVKVGLAGACQQSYSFTTPPASGGSSMYPTKLALVADLGTTEISAKSVSALKAMNAVAIVFTGDLSYGKLSKHSHSALNVCFESFLF